MSPAWVFEIPLVGQTLGDLWNRWAADITAVVAALRPYFGIVLEGGLSLLLGLANGVLLFVLALFIAFFFYLYGEPIAARLRVDPACALPAARAERLIDVTGATVRGVVFGILRTAIVQGVLTAFGLVVVGRAAAGAAGCGCGLPGGAADRCTGRVDPRRAVAAEHRPSWLGASSWQSMVWWLSPAPTRDPPVVHRPRARSCRSC